MLTAQTINRYSKRGMVASHLPIFIKEQAMYKEHDVSLSISGSEVKRIAPLVQGDTNNIVNMKIVDGNEAFDLSSFDFVTATIQPPEGDSFIVLGEAAPSSTSLEIVDAVQGLLLLRIQGLGATIVGMHKLFIQLWRYDVAGEQPSWADGTVTRISTARLNYDILESLDPMENAFDGETLERYNILIQLIAKLTEFQNNELLRSDNEEARQAAEIERESITNGIIEQVTVLLEDATTAETLCRQWYGAIAELVATNVFDAQELPAYATDIELAALKVEIASEVQYGTIVPKAAAAYVADITAPADLTKLWIDTAHNNVIKFYDGTDWVSTATATFS